MHNINKIPAYVLGAILFLAAGWAHAQGGQDAKDKAKAKKLFKEGVSYFESGKHAQALEAFEKSYELKPHWAIRFNLGLCYKELGMYTKAKSEFLDFIEEGGSGVKDATEKEVEKELAFLNGIIAVIEIDVNVEDAEIWMDGKFFDNTPLEEKVDLDPGSHLLTIQKKGYETYEEEFILSKGERKSFKISLLPSKTGPAETGDTGKKKKDKKKKDKDIKDDTVVEDTGAARPPKTRKKWAMPLFAAGLSLTVAGIAVGGAMLGMAYQKKGEMDDWDLKWGPDIEAERCTGQCYDDYLAKRNDIADQGKLYATLTPVFFGVAGAAAVVTIVAVVVGHPFAKPGVEKQPSPGLTMLQSLRVGVLATDRDRVLTLHMSF
jgi:hypothetical protein